MSGGLSNAAIFIAHTYVSPWMFQGSLFIPIIPTHSDNLAGTAHLMVQPWIGRAWVPLGLPGIPPTSSSFPVTLMGSRSLTRKRWIVWGTGAEAQYYFTNQWYLNAAYGVTAVFNFNEANQFDKGLRTVFPTGTDTTDEGHAAGGRHAVVSPIKALKFGLQYSYVHAQYLSDAYPGGAGILSGVKRVLGETL